MWGSGWNTGSYREELFGRGGGLLHKVQFKWPPFRQPGEPIEGILFALVEQLLRGFKIQDGTSYEGWSMKHGSD